MLDVFLNSACFVNLIASTAEGLPNEVAGLLFGDYIDDDDQRVIIWQAIPLQIVERTPHSLEYESKRMKRVYSLWDNLTPYWPVEEFHSHPYRSNEKLDPTPSKTDKEAMKKGDIEVIISAKKTQRRRRLRYDKSGLRIAGTVFHYQIEIAAWHRKNRRRIEEVQLHCPYIKIINLGYKLGLAPKPGLLWPPDTVSSLENMRNLRRLIAKYEECAFKTVTAKGCKEEMREIKRVLRKIRKENRE